MSLTGWLQEGVEPMLDLQVMPTAFSLPKDKSREVYRMILSKQNFTWCIEKCDNCQKGHKTYICINLTLGHLWAVQQAVKTTLTYYYLKKLIYGTAAYLHIQQT